MRWISLIISLLLVIAGHCASAQQTLHLKPDASCGKDALLHGLSSEVNINYGNDPQLAAISWTFGGIPGDVRGIVQFDLSSIPAGCNIIDARLSLYAWDQSNGLGQHSSLSGPNTTLINRVTSSWNENTVTWNNQPVVTSVNQVILPSTSNPLQDFLNINVTAMVQDMVNDPQNSFGFMLRLQNEDYYRNMNFCSSDHPIPANHPELIIVCDCTFEYLSCDSTPGTPLPSPTPAINIPFPPFQNVFTPNGDGVNDLLTFSSDAHNQLRVSIYNRWGNEVFTSSGDVISWSGENVHEGVYYYVLNATEKQTGKAAATSGFIQLLR